MSRVLQAAAMAGGVLALIPGLAAADDLILRCKGTVEQGNAEPKASWKYYRVGSESWGQYDKGSPGWRGGGCAYPLATCEIGADAYRMKYRSNSLNIDQDVTIDRPSGAVLDVLTQSGVKTTFRGQCKPSEDPLPDAARRY